MPETLKKTQVFRFDQMAVQVKDKVEPAEADEDRYVGLEHIDPESLKIRRWGEPSDVESSKILFRSGDIIFGKRRAYQRKLAVADFGGICSAHAMVLRPKTEVVLEEFLPFFMQSDIFMDRAVKISVGGLSPTINWKDLAKEEFSLPPLETQRRIAKVLQALDHLAGALLLQLECLDVIRTSARAEQFPIRRKRDAELSGRWTTIEDVAEFTRGLTYKGEQASDSQSDGATECVGIPCISSSERIDQTKKVYVTGVSEEQFGKRQLMKGATLLIGSNGNPDRVGDCVYVQEDSRQTFGGFLLQATTSSDTIRPEYLFHLLASPSLQAAVSAEARGSTGLRNLNLNHLKQFCFPLPPLADQDAFISLAICVHEAFECIDGRLSECKQLKRVVLAEFAGVAP